MAKKKGTKTKLLNSMVEPGSDARITRRVTLRRFGIHFPLPFDKRKAEWDWNADFEWSVAESSPRAIRYFERS